MLPQINNQSADSGAFLGEFLQFGTISSVDLAAALAIVDLGDVQTPPIPWLAIAGSVKSFVPPSVGEQVAVLVPDEDVTGAIIIGGLFSNQNPAPANSTVLLMKNQNGDYIEYNIQTGLFKLTLSGNFEIEAANIQITAPNIDINGDINLTGKLTATDDVIAAGKSLKTHKHLLVKSGTDISGAPQ
jgi:phage baseplate assembly protein V